MSANENYINTIPRQTDIDTLEEDYVNTASCKRVESNIYETVFDDTQWTFVSWTHFSAASTAYMEYQKW